MQRKISTWESKIFQGCFGLHRSVIGPGNSRHPSNQSESNLKPIVTWSLAFSIASGSLLIFLICVLIGSSWSFHFLWLAFVIYLPLLYDPLAKYALLREAAFRSLFQNQFEIWSAGKCHSEQLMRTQSKNKRIAHRLGKRQ